jgi:hypothetical protein
MLNRLYAAAAVLGVSMTLAACGVSSEEKSNAPVAVKELSEGLTLFKIDGKISGAFRKADHAIYFETLRGQPRNAFYKQVDPTLPDFEIDIRVLDEDGRPIFIQQAGDQLADESWVKDILADAKKPRVDPYKRAEHYELMKEAFQTLESANVPAALSMEKSVLVASRFSIKESVLKTGIAKASEAMQAEKGYAPGWNSIELHRKSIMLGLGEHSATWANVNGVVYDNCNHGSCASSMGYKCTTYGGGALYWEGSTSNGWRGGTCLTSYNWTSWGNHNCHDDSVKQMWGVVYGTQGTDYDGVCDNGAGHKSAPSCWESSW